MSKPVEVDIALGILDHQLVDSDGVNCGKVDDLELTGLDTDSRRVVEILVGGNAWRSRGLLGRLFGAFRRRCRARAWSEVESFGGREAEAARCGAAPEPRRPAGRGSSERCRAS